MKIDGLKPVEGQEDTFAFQYDFVPEGKSVESDVVTELDDGDLLIEGYAARFDGTDRQGENFAPGAFQRGIDNYMNGQATICYNHDHEKVLGKTLELEEEEGKGLRFKGRIDGAIKDDPTLGTIYKQIKKGTINALSVGGFFRRGLTDKGRRITDCDFTEISTTGVPVHPLTSFSVLAGKALESAEEEPVEEEVPEAALAAVIALEGIYDRLEGRKALPPNYDAAAASALSRLLNCIARAREEATYATSVGADNETSDVNSFADRVETALAAFESEAHQLAAQIGPLPPQGSYF